MIVFPGMYKNEGAEKMKRIISVALVGLISVLAIVFSVPEAEAAFSLVNGESYTVEFIAEKQEIAGMFKPQLSGYYTVWSTGEADSYVKLYQGSTTENLLKANNNAAEGEKNFKLKYYLHAGVQYRFDFSNRSGLGSYTVHFTESLPSLNDSNYVNVKYAGERIGYKFTPEKSGLYRVYSVNTYDPSMDPRGFFYDSDFKQIINDSNSGRKLNNDLNDTNFALLQYMQRGKTYFIGVASNIDSQTGGYHVYCDYISPASLVIQSADGKPVYFYKNDVVKKDKIKLAVTYKEEDTKRLPGTIPEYIPAEDYDVSCDTTRVTPNNKPSKLVVSYGDEKRELDVAIKLPKITVEDERGNQYSGIDFCSCSLKKSGNNILTASTSPGNVDVIWSSSDRDILLIESVPGNPNAVNVSVKAFLPSTQKVYLTAEFVYNNDTYACRFPVTIDLGDIYDVKLESYKTKYSYGSGFKREKVRVSYFDHQGNKKEEIFNSWEKLPKTKVTPGVKTRSIQVGDSFTLKYKYTIIPAKPKNVTIIPLSDRKQKVEWDKTGGATGYIIYMSTSKTGTYERIAKTSDTSCTIDKLPSGKKLSPGGKYYYKVKAYYQDKKTTLKGSSSEIAGNRTKLSTPVISSVNPVSSTGIKIKWSAVSKAKGYYIYIAKSKNGEYKRIGTTDKTAFVAERISAKEMLSPYTRYYFKVKAFYSDDRSLDSKASEYEAGRTKLSKPSGVKIKSTSSSTQTLTWNEVKSAEGYIICRADKKDGKYKEIKTIKGGGTTKYTVKSLKANKGYYYTITAYASTSKYNSESVVVAGTTLLSAPSAVSSAVVGDKIRILWKPSDGANGYYVYRSVDGGKFEKIYTGSANYYDDGEVISGKTYKYRVKAYKSSNGKVINKSVSKEVTQKY